MKFVTHNFKNCIARMFCKYTDNVIYKIKSKKSPVFRYGKIKLDLYP